VAVARRPIEGAARRAPQPLNRGDVPKGRLTNLTRFAVPVFVAVYALLGIAATQLDLVDDGKPNHLGFFAAAVISVLMLVLALVVGSDAKGRLDGVLIDRYNRITLTHFQIVLWTVLVLASYSGALFTNLLAGSSAIDALDVSIPPELWLAMGISGGSFAASKAIKLKIPDAKIDKKSSPAEARWVQMFTSDVDDGQGSVDLSKLQMFFFTVVLVFGYAAGVANELIDASTKLTQLPALNDTFVTLLLISHGTYLARKSAHLIPDSKT
jgi:hypothetical protein